MKQQKSSVWRGLGRHLLQREGSTRLTATALIAHTACPLARRVLAAAGPGRRVHPLVGAQAR
jgi:hypothetical protein